MLMCEPDQDNLTVKEAAALLGYDAKYLYDLLYAGVIPFRQRARGCKIVISRAELERRFPNKLRKRTA